MFIGDSINFELYQSLVHLLGKQMDKELHVMAVKQKKEEHQLLSMFVGVTMLH